MRRVILVTLGVCLWIILGFFWDREKTKRETSTGENAVCSCSGDRYDCKDFSTQNQAQACFDFCKSQKKGDVHNLARDKDGIACESLP